jgi:hypothetical protein
MGRGYPLFVPAKGARDANGKPGPGYVDVEVERAKRYAHDLGIAVRRGKVAVESVDAGVVSPISPEDFAVWVAANDAGPIHKPAPARAATG